MSNQLIVCVKAMSASKNDWKLWLQVALTIITAIASALGVTSCAMKVF